MRRLSGAVVGVLLALVGCTPDKLASDQPLLVGRANDAIALDPARVTDSESAEVTEQIFDHLVRYKPDSAEIEPSLAESWDSADGRVWTFHLRKNVRFHDGTPFDAAAVVFSFDRQRDPHHPFHQDDFTYWENTFRNIQAVEALDSSTVRITIERSYAPFLSNLAMFPVSIVSPAAVRKWGSEFARHPVGTGPFRFVEWSPGERIMLASNPNYWGGAPKIQHLVFVAIRDARQRLVALEGGAIDVAENLSPEDLQFVALHPELTLLRVAANNVAYLAMNTTHPPFDDVRVRRAVNFAINKTAIVKLIYQGLAKPASTPVPPAMWSHVDETDYHYDRNEAMKLLAAAHYTRPAKRPRLFVMDTPRTYMPAPETVARIIQHNLRDVGMDVEVVVNDFETQVRMTQNGEHDLCLLGWTADTADPDNFLYVLFDPENAEPGTARNLAFFKNAELHGILSWAQESSDRHERERFYKKAQDLISHEAPWVPLAHGEAVVAARANLGALRVHPSSTVYFQRVYRK
ncbi:MAG: peptide/nickel transport system substrate-binding protein [Myxococcales bacterium]|nr:peptide/nickel transport system substrate-binding protein [Myxococcales bacterium]